MLEIRGLSAAIEDKPILQGIDLTVPQGEVHAIMGPNGSGKSTLAYVLSGREDYVVTGGSRDVRWPRPAGDGAGGARGRRAVPGLPVPGRAARRRQRQFPAHRAECASAASRGESELDAVQFLKLARAETKRLACRTTC